MTKLAIEENRDRIIEALAHSNRLVLSAEPGAGKTTKVPVFLLKFGSVLVLQPRRLACRTAAMRVAEENNWTLANEVGYQTRYEKKLGSATKLVFATEGMFVQLLKKDRLLRAYNSVVLDEFHERSAPCDTNLALITYLQKIRPALKLVIMSATLDASSLLYYLGQKAQLLKIKGRLFDVSISYRPEYDPQDTKAVIDACSSLFEKTKGHILVFLWGRAAIEACIDRASRVFKDTELLPLYASLDIKRQQQVFSKSGRRKIIFSTNVAETSLTIEGVEAVIDTGLARVSDYAYWSGLDTLELREISQFSCKQRSGRAGRTQNGVCWRLFSESNFLKRSLAQQPEIRRTELSRWILDLQSLLPAGKELENELDWLEKPPKKNLDLAKEFLKNIEAINSQVGVTDLGRRLASYKLHPRLAFLVEKAIEMDIAALATLAACIVSEGFILNDKFRFTTTGSCDLYYQIKVLIYYEKNDLEANIISFIDRKKIQAVLGLYKQFREQLGLENIKDIRLSDLSERKLRKAIFLAYFDRIARYRPQGKSKRNPALRFYHFCQGGGGVLSDYSQVGKADYLVVIDANENLDRANAASRISIRIASSIEESELLEQQKMLGISEDFEEKTHKFFKRCYYGKLLLWEEEQAYKADYETLLSRVKKQWPWPFKTLDDLKIYHRKLSILDQCQMEHNFPRFEGELLACLQEEVASRLVDEDFKLSLEEFITEQLDEAQKIWLRELFPSEFMLLRQKPFELFWDGEELAIKAKIQEFLGLTKHPSLLEGKYPLKLIMLAPNYRAAQITRDLLGFWKSSYAEVRKELKRRYPKHFWPENPLAPGSKLRE